MTRTVAAFDFDGTVSQRDTLVPFLVKAAGATKFAAVAAQLGLHGARGTVNLRNRDDVKARMVELLLAGRSADELDALGASYAEDLVASKLRPFMVDRVRGRLGEPVPALLTAPVVAAEVSAVATALGVAVGLAAR